MMDVPVPAVVRGEFVYRDTLFVDVGKGRHPRASEAELRALLTGKSSQDQVGHWWEAQLIHYGLQRSKEKNTAKVRLQQALNQGKLKAPPLHVADMEGQMKKDYASALRKAKSRSKHSAVDNSERSTPKAQKRKFDATEPDSSKRTKISMNVGDISINIEHGSQGSSKKKGIAKITDTVPKASSGSVTKGKKQPAQIKEPSLSKSAKHSKDEGDSATPPLKSTTSKATSSKPPGASTQSTAKPRTKSKVKPKTLAESKAEAKPHSLTKSEPKIKEEPVIQKASPIKKETKIKVENSDNSIHDRGAGPKQRNVTGVYQISSPQLEEQLPESVGNHRMFLCIDGDAAWGGFQLAMKSGVMRIDNITIDETLSFGWRARDSWEGDRLSFGRGCFGDIELYGHEQIRGTFYNLFNEPMTFEGQRRPGPLWCGRSAYSFQQEWDGFVSQAYGR